MVPFSGWEMPVQYTGVTDEHAAVRNAVGLFDVSHMGELFFAGPGACAFIDSLVTSDIAALEVGQARYTVACNERGTILDDLIVYRLADAHYMVVCNAGNLDKISAHFARQVQDRCVYTDRSADTALLALQGPRAAELVGLLGAQDLVALPRFGVVTDTQLAGVTLTAARTGYTGEDGYELFCATDQVVRLWQALLDAGQPLGIKPIGLGARDTVRLEARLSLYGNELDETTTPFEAGLGWVVKLDKPDFLGKQALQQARALPQERVLVGFEMVGRGIARHGYPIVADGKTVGIVTSGAPGLSLGKNIGLGYVPPHYKKVGTSIAIEIRQQPVAAVVCATPFYKRAIP